MGWSIAGLWRPTFPDAELVGVAADLLPAIRETGGRDATLSEEPRWEVVLSPGVIQVRTGIMRKSTVTVNGRSCIAVPHPHIPATPRNFTPAS